MKRIVSAVLAVAMTASIVLASTQADARGRGGAVAAGVAAGVLGAAIIGSAVAPRYGYAEPVYVAPRRCWADRERWSNRRQAYVIERVRVPC